MQYQKYCLSEASYQLGQCCAVRRLTCSTTLKSADPLDAFDRAIGEVIGRLVPIQLFCIVVLEKSYGLMPAAGKLMMLSRLLIVPGVEHAVQIIGVNLCLLMWRLRGSMMLQGSNTMNSRGGVAAVYVCLVCNFIAGTSPQKSIGARREQVRFSKAIENWELMDECFPKHLRMGEARLK